MNIERKLASVRTISALSPIKNADRIEVATIGGWKVVVEKGLYQAGDQVIYFEVDSWLPTEIAPELSRGKEPREFKGVKGERLKTVKLRGQVSQGFVLPIPFFLEKGLLTEEDIAKNEDITEKLGILKYEKEDIDTNLGFKGMRPFYIPKTAAERIQNLTYEAIKDEADIYYVTEKLDGTSASFGIINGEKILCSRNMELELGSGVHYLAVEKYLDLLADFPQYENIVLQGEVVGTKVQGDRYKLCELKFFAFAACDVRANKYLNQDEFQKMLAELDILAVPAITTIKLVEEMPAEKDDAICYLTEDVFFAEVYALTDRKSALENKTQAEGIVLRSYDGVTAIKSISEKFLLKNDL